MGNRAVETLVGTLVLAVAGYFVFYIYTTSQMGVGKDSYEIAASFDRIDGLAVGSDVRMSGVKIGTVAGQSLDPNSFLARVELSIDKAINLPEDTSAKVASDGLLGGAYISLEAGGAMDLLAPGDEIEFTQGSIDLMSLIGQAVFSITDSETSASTQ